MASAKRRDAAQGTPLRQLAKTWLNRIRREKQVG
jgi:hypothetical protein